MGIAARGLGKCFGSRWALRGVSLEVRPGEVCGLIGVNGAGKTTCMRLIVGLMRPTEGAVSVCGVDSAESGPNYRAKLGYASHSTGLYNRLTVEQLLDYFATLYGATRAAERIEELGRSLDFTHLLARRIEKLSNGEKQRVSLARAVIHRPEVLILDEPTAGLDILASRSVLDFVRAERSLGRAILFSTHYMTEAELLCDRIAVVHNGTLVADGTPEQLKHRFRVSLLEQLFLTLDHESKSDAGFGCGPLFR